MTSPKADVRVVCFDLGGVLVRICRSWDQACEQIGLPYRSPGLLATEAWRMRRKAVVDRYQLGGLSAGDYHEELSRALEGLYSAEEVERIHEAWTLKEYPGALELVRELNRLPGVATACLSNTNAAHWRRLSNEDGSAEYPSVLELEHRLASHLLGCAKPDAEIYARAQATFFGARQGAPEQIFFFDDLPENVEAARAQGWSAFQVDHEGDTVSQMRAQLARAGLPL
ncbi:MAG: HAD family hydrolase [Deltaproteobacteria bacterium]